MRKLFHKLTLQTNCMEKGFVQVPLLRDVEAHTNLGYFDHFRKELIEMYLRPNPISAGQGLLHWSAAHSGDVPRLTSHFKDLTERQPEWKNLGFVPNKNRFIEEDECVQLLEQCPQIRQQVYSGNGPW